MSNSLNKLFPLIIIGAGGHAISVANVAKSAGFKIKYFIDLYKKAQKLLDIDIISKISELQDVDRYCYFIAIGDNFVRQQVYNELTTKYPNLYFPSLIHTSATISDDVSIGDGSVIMPKAIVGPSSTVGKFCILNTQSSMDHNCSISDFSSLAPGAITGGNVNIGMRTAISIGAIIKHDITIADDSVVGANSYLNKDLVSNKVAFGSPAKIIKNREMSDPYL